jgi:predicted O-methyltransferase YrrM
MMTLVRSVLPRGAEKSAVRVGDRLALALEPKRATSFEGLLDLSRAGPLLDMAGLASSHAAWAKASAQIFALLPDGQGGPVLGTALGPIKAPSGSTNPGDRRAIYTLVHALRSRSVLEIGSYVGSSLISIGAAMRDSAAETGEDPGEIVSVDIVDINAPDGPWKRNGVGQSPRAALDTIGGPKVSYLAADASHFLRTTSATFDFIFLDGSHKAADVYREIHLAQRVLRPGGVVLLHDFFPEDRELWPGSRTIPGPWYALERLKREGAPVTAAPFGALPWPTKKGGNVTSLALLLRRTG